MSLLVRYFNIPSIRSYSNVQTLLKNLFSSACAPLGRRTGKSGKNATVSFMPLKLKNSRHLTTALLGNGKYKLTKGSVKNLATGLAFRCPQNTQLSPPWRHCGFSLIYILLMALVEGINVIFYQYFSPPVRQDRNHAHFLDLSSVRSSLKQIPDIKEI